MSRSTTREIDSLRSVGLTPTAIAEKLGISVNTVKSHIRRRNKNSVTLPFLFCVRPVPQNAGRKEKKYCSDKCRMHYWNKRYRSKEAADGTA